MQIFILPMLTGDKSYIECTVEFKIKEDKSVNETNIQQKALE